VQRQPGRTALATRHGRRAISSSFSSNLLFFFITNLAFLREGYTLALITD
jgi:hypothetical protein